MKSEKHRDGEKKMKIEREREEKVNLRWDDKYKIR